MADAAVSKTVGKPCEFESHLGHHLNEKHPFYGVLFYCGEKIAMGCGGGAAGARVAAQRRPAPP